MNHQTIAIADLSLDPSNVRKHSRRNLDAIKASLRKFGQQKPIVVDAKGIVLAGNGTLTAAQELGWTEIQIVRTELAGVEATAFAIADNRTAELAEWEEDKLSQVLQSIKVEDADLLAATGYDAAEVDKMSKAEVIEDEAPEPPADPITKAGDLWILGEHRVLCGDSTNPEAVTKLMNGKKADLLFTDPPYGVDYEGVTNDHLKADQLRLFIFSVLKNVDSVLKAGACFYIWHPDIHAYEFIGAVRDVKWTQAKPAIIQWLKNALVLSQGDYHLRNEPCLYGWKSGAAHKRVEDRTQDTIWEFPKPSRSSQHPTMKPVALCSRAIINSSESNWIVSDPFLGSGTTLIAAEQLNRKCYGLEISPAYCDVIVQRWENLTGKKAVLDKATT
jgi:DNA modification methylase